MEIDTSYWDGNPEADFLSASAYLDPTFAEQERLHDYRGVIHCHSYLSHDSHGSANRIISAAHRAKLDFLIMTDHYTDQGVIEAIRGFRGKTLFVAGAEFVGFTDPHDNPNQRPRRSKYEKFRADLGYGSLLALGLNRPLDRNSGSPTDIADEIHQQGGLVFLGHLERWKYFDGIPFDGVEIYNIHAAATKANKGGLLLRGVLEPPGRTYRSLLRLWPNNIELWNTLLESRAVPISAGNDEHENVKIYSVTGGRVATYEQSFRAVTTHVWAKNLTEQDVLGALREGRSYVEFDGVRDATGFFVSSINSPDGQRWVVSLPAPAHVIIRQGRQIVLEGDGRLFESPPAVPGRFYSVEAYLSGKPWIIAGPFAASYH